MIGPLLARARATHAQILTDTCQISRTTRGALNTTTGQYATTTEVLYTGACRVKGPGAGQAAVDDVTAGEAQQQRTRQALVLPHWTARPEYSPEYAPASYDTRSVRPGDVVVITAGSLVGASFVVVGQVDSTTMTGHSILIEAVAQ